MRTRHFFKQMFVSGLAMALLASGSVQAATTAPYDPAAWKADYAQLKSVLEKEYANLAWFGSFEGGADLPWLDKRTQAALAAARTDDEARLALTQFVARFHDGHFSVLPTLTPAATPPLTVSRQDFDPNDPVSTCAGLGFLPSSAIAFSMPLEGLPGFKLRFDGMSSVYRAGIATTAAGIKIGVIRIQNFRMRAFPGACTLAWAKLVRDQKPITSESVRDAAYKLWFDAFRDEMEALRADGASMILVDVGNNSGGDDTGDYFPRMLTDKAVKSAPLRVVASPTGTQYLNESIRDIDEALADTLSPAAHDAFVEARAYYAHAKDQVATSACDMSWVWRDRRHYPAIACTRTVAAGYAGGYFAGLPKGIYGDKSAWLSLPSEIEDRWGTWTGPVYVLTDGKSYSSAEMFTAVVQDNHIGKTVGQKTGGDGCGFMVEAEPVTLTHSRLRLRIPNCMRIRADGRDEVAGISPDLPILPTEGEDDRQRAARMLETIAADAANHH
ncbi:S41 family peptidase [Asticcacaulis sp. 201]|uniref:S41 family peptidase n=1 Tax=Asticcacaulis sp. 201 TaxID=3028787 RepID=UPI002915F828|nr:S41 family peptidase [Asticcacaulis sp. 201]MDV6330936.1 S41 family peptidase [Asticcacaulis sp. 201]